MNRAKLLILLGCVTAPKPGNLAQSPENQGFGAILARFPTKFSTGAVDTFKNLGKSATYRVLFTKSRVLGANLIGAVHG